MIRTEPQCILLDASKTKNLLPNIPSSIVTIPMVMTKKMVHVLLSKSGAKPSVARKTYSVSPNGKVYSTLCPLQRLAHGVDGDHSTRATPSNTKAMCACGL
mmetsp:Transcript_14860/g.14771  ORF Transcript_14860/g.14771 Transcript_14860/m.14771 type:complete len:101 (+) Transcript_14860:2-304(+)